MISIRGIRLSVIISRSSISYRLALPIREVLVFLLIVAGNVDNNLLILMHTNTTLHEDSTSQKALLLGT